MSPVFNCDLLKRATWLYNAHAAEVIEVPRIRQDYDRKTRNPELENLAEVI
jgi:hypothetical protein